MFNSTWYPLEILMGESVLNSEYDLNSLSHLGKCYSFSRWKTPLVQQSLQKAQDSVTLARQRLWRNNLVTTDEETAQVTSHQNIHSSSRDTAHQEQ